MGGVRSGVYLMDSAHFAVHTRTVFDLPVLGKTIDFPMVGFFEHCDGFVTDYKEYWDTAYMLHQLRPGAAFPPASLHLVIAKRHRQRAALASPAPLLCRCRSVDRRRGPEGADRSTSVAKLGLCVA